MEQPAEMSQQVKIETLRTLIRDIDTEREWDLMICSDSKKKPKLYPSANDKGIGVQEHQGVIPDVIIVKNRSGLEAIASLDVGEISFVQCCVQLVEQWEAHCRDN